MPAEFDITVYGASGFTGRLVAEYLVTRYGSGSDVNWAQSAICLMRDAIDTPGGVWTPGAAFGQRAHRPACRQCGL